MNYFNVFFNFLNKYENNIYILWGFVILLFIGLAGRIIIYFAYQTQFMIFKLNSKTINLRSDIKISKVSVLGRSVNSYLNFADKGYSNINIQELVKTQFIRISFLGFSYASMSNLVKLIEKNIVIIGILLTLIFDEYSYVYAGAMLIFFILVIIFSTIFDFDTLEVRIIKEISEYIQLEMGKFFQADTSGILLSFKNEMKESYKEQSKLISEAITKMGDNISGVMSLSISEISKTFNFNSIKINDTVDSFIRSMDEWNKKILNAKDLQDSININLDLLKTISCNTEDIFDKMSGILKLYKLEDIENRQDVLNQIEGLKEVVSQLEKNSLEVNNSTQYLKSQLSYIEKNQGILELTVSEYEQSLHKLTHNIGDVFSNLVTYNAETVYTKLNERLENNIKQIINNNHDLVQRLQKVFENVNEQSAGHAKAIMQIKEEMKMNFEQIDDKLSNLNKI